MNNEQHYKFMTNILVSPKDREIYLSFLKKSTKDAMVPTIRFITAGIVLVSAIIFIVWYMIADIDRFKYIALPSIILLLSIVQLCYYYIVSSRRKSMLSSVINMLLTKIAERVRMKSSEFGELRTIGVKSFKNGYLLFEDGDYGILYAVVGQLDKSILPQVAKQVHDIRYNYFISRNETSHEMTITSIKRLNVDAQTDYYKRIYQSNTTKDESQMSLLNLWNRRMSEIMTDEMESKVEKNEVSIYQYLILRDSSSVNLAKSQNAFELACDEGMYSSARIITDTRECLEALGPLAMLSKKGEKMYVEKAQKATEEERFGKN